MDILVAGGAGYVGSHTVVALLEAGHNVIIADNLTASNEQVVRNIERIVKHKVAFYKADINDHEAVDYLFANYDIDGVMHFAGCKSDIESLEKPLKYYRNNVISTIVLAEACMRYKVNRFVFSSTAKIYGNSEAPFEESMDVSSKINPFTESKVMSEQILKDTAKAHPEFKVVLLRYFNPIGAHSSGLLGEDPSGESDTLMPYINRVAKGIISRVKVFGDDYNTKDGTGVRDYTHVMDVAEGHVAALENLKSGVHTYNLGTGKGTSVLELINAFEKENMVKVPYDIVGRREGDLAESFADVNKAKSELGWVAKRNVNDMVKDTWRYEKNKSKKNVKRKNS
ncbi:MAG: UDP-glucose 4-epimerase GalE [Clostridia bacterium]